jgi:hypothetical protein
MQHGARWNATRACDLPATLAPATRQATLAPATRQAARTPATWQATLAPATLPATLVIGMLAVTMLVAGLASCRLFNLDLATLSISCSYGYQYNPDATLAPPDIYPQGSEGLSIMMMARDTANGKTYTHHHGGSTPARVDFSVQPGSYEIIVLVYAGQAGLVATIRQSTSIGAGDVRVMDLSPVSTEGESGSLVLDLSLPDNLAAERLEIAALAGRTELFYYDEQKGNSVAVAWNLPSGIYDLHFKWYDAVDNLIMEVYRRALIVPGYKSKATVVLDAAARLAAPDKAASLGVVSGSSSLMVRLEWDDPSPHEQFWDIERSADNGSTWISLANSLHYATTGFADRLVVPGAVYQYRLRSRNSFGTLGWTDSSAITIPGSGTLGGWIVDATITELDGRDNTPYPVSLSHVFKTGDAVDALAIALDGQELPSQTDIKLRWPDGSIKHAIISFLLPSLPANGTVRVSIHNGARSNATAAADMSRLHGAGFSARFNYSGNAASIDLASLVTDQAIQEGSARTWLAGSIANEVVVSDFLESSSRLTTWAAIRSYAGYPGVRIFHAVENAKSEDGSSDEPYSLQVHGQVDFSGDPDFQGSAAFSRIVCDTGSLTSEFDTRHGRVSWIGAEPSRSHVAYDSNYLIATRVLPSYDTSLVVPESAIASIAAQWSSADTSPGGNGLLMKYLPGTGWRYEIGLLPQFTVMYLLTMDRRLADVVVGHGLISGHVNIHIREDRTGASARGRFISIDDRPNAWLMRAGWPNGAADNPPGRPWESYSWGYDSNGHWTNEFWMVDRAHQGSLAYVPYLITGDVFFLEELYFWNAWNLASCWPADWPAGRGGSAGYIKDQVRGDAWTVRELGRVVGIAPDAHTFEKAYFTSKLNNAYLQWIDHYITNTYHPLGIWDYISQRGIDGGRPSEYFSYKVRYISTPWQEYFLLQSLTHVEELLAGASGVQHPLLGNAPTRVRQFVAASMTSLVNGAAGPERAFSYRLPVSVMTVDYPLAVSDIFNAASWRHLDSWEDVEACYIKDISDVTVALPWQRRDELGDLPDPPEYWEDPLPDYPMAWPKSADFNDIQGSPVCTAIDYPMVCLGAMAGTLDVPGGLAAYNTVRDLLVDERSLYNANPTFALVPRP